MTVTIQPSGLDNDRLLRQYHTALQVKSRLESAASSDQDILLDLSTAEWFAPTFLTPISTIINRLQNEGANIGTSQSRFRRITESVSFSGDHRGVLGVASR
jgi:hypothetical protein